MMIASLLSLSLLLCTQVQGATIAELVTARSKAAAAVSQNPLWAQSGSYTLFVPTDAAIQAANLTAGSIGKVFVNKAIK
jgi:uncharacterized surface protein with fasciclin (FAS1) repeats